MGRGTGSTDRPPSVGSRKCFLEKGAALPEEPGSRNGALAPGTFCHLRAKASGGD